MADLSKTPNEGARVRQRPRQDRFDPSDPPLPRRPGPFAAPFSSALDIARAIRSLAWLGILVLFLALTLKVDLVIFAGVLLAISLRRTADRVSRLTRIPTGWAVVLVLLLVLAFFAGIGWFFSQGIASQIDQLSRQLPTAADKFESIISQSSLGKVVIEHLQPASINPSTMMVLQNFFGVASNLVEVVGAVAVIMFLGLYFAVEANLYVAGLLRLVPPPRRGRVAEILHETASAIWYWMLGRLVSMTALGFLTAAGLWAIGVPLPIALGFLAGILTFIPFIGGVVSAIPSLLLAVSVNLDMALYVIALYIGVHLIEAYILVPLVQRQVVHLPPALTLSAQILFGVLAGFLGLLLATPLVAAALVIVRMVYVEDVLGDRGVIAPARCSNPNSLQKANDPGSPTS
jgi:predicted PurR-regulated permease PerM